MLDGFELEYFEPYFYSLNIKKKPEFSSKENSGILSSCYRSRKNARDSTKIKLVSVFHNS